MNSPRSDGRTPDAMRRVTLERGFTKHAPGSVLVSFGDTKVICTACFESRVPNWLRERGQGWLSAEYAMLPSATHERGSRDAAHKGRAQEISRLIGRSLRTVIDLKAIGPCQITVDCDVIQADGGTRTAAITGAFVAVHDALAWSVKQGNLPAVPILMPCAAISVGLVDGQPLLDLAYEEDARATVDFNVVMSEGGAYIEVQGCGETGVFTGQQMQAMLGLAEKGVAELLALQHETLGLD